MKAPREQRIETIQTYQQAFRYVETNIAKGNTAKLERQFSNRVANKTCKHGDPFKFRTTAKERYIRGKVHKGTKITCDKCSGSIKLADGYMTCE